MGPFSYVPFMECNHAILCMRNSISGSIHLNDDIYNFNHGIGYIEKDWGCSFPKSYVWCQGNNFAHSDASFLLSIADIPFMSMNFKGLICVLIIGQKEYRFASYNRSRITKYEITEKGINIQLQRKSYTLSITSYYEVGHVLSAPVEGKMDKNIYESISASINVTLKENSTILFSDTSTCCGLEIV